MQNTISIDIPAELIGQVMFVDELIKRPNPNETALHYTEMLEHAIAEKLFEVVRKQAINIL